MCPVNLTSLVYCSLYLRTHFRQVSPLRQICCGHSLETKALLLVTQHFTLERKAIWMWVSVHLASIYSAVLSVRNSTELNDLFQ